MRYLPPAAPADSPLIALSDLTLQWNVKFPAPSRILLKRRLKRAGARDLARALRSERYKTAALTSVLGTKRGAELLFPCRAYHLIFAVQGTCDVAPWTVSLHGVIRVRASVKALPGHSPLVRT